MNGKLLGVQGNGAGDIWETRLRRRRWWQFWKPRYYQAFVMVRTDCGRFTYAGE
jgi:hypothetical protein